MAFLFSGGGLVPPSVHMSDEGPDHASMARPVGTEGSEGPLVDIHSLGSLLRFTPKVNKYKLSVSYLLFR